MAKTAVIEEKLHMHDEIQSIKTQLEKAREELKKVKEESEDYRTKFEKLTADHANLQSESTAMEQHFMRFREEIEARDEQIADNLFQIKKISKECYDM